MAATTDDDRATRYLPSTDAGAKRAAGGLFAGLAAEFVLAMTLCAAMAPGYHVGRDPISDLGVVPETALLLNGSLLLAGAAAVAGGYLLYRVHGRRWLLALFVLSGVGTAGVGVFTLDAGWLHAASAFVAFLFLNAAVLGSGTVVRGPMRALAALAGVVGLGFLAVFVLWESGGRAWFGPIGYGGAERMIVYPGLLWLVAFGGYLLGTADGDPA